MPSLTRCSPERSRRDSVRPKASSQTAWKNARMRGAPSSPSRSRRHGWNRKAALNTPARHEFSRAYETLDAKLKSRFTFKYIPEGGGRCRNRNIAYWYAAGDLRICPGLIGLASPDERGLAVLAALYAYESLVDGNDRQDRAASEAQRLHSANVPSAADVLSGS
jgi:hypothetical protein